MTRTLFAMELTEASVGHVQSLCPSLNDFNCLGDWVSASSQLLRPLECPVPGPLAPASPLPPPRDLHFLLRWVCREGSGWVTLGLVRWHRSKSPVWDISRNQYDSLTEESMIFFNSKHLGSVWSEIWGIFYTDHTEVLSCGGSGEEPVDPVSLVSWRPPTLCTVPERWSWARRQTGSQVRSSQSPNICEYSMWLLKSKELRKSLTMVLGAWEHMTQDFGPTLAALWRKDLQVNQYCLKVTIPLDLKKGGRDPLDSN